MGGGKKSFALLQCVIFFFSKVMIKSVEDLNEMATTQIAKHFPEVIIWNSHLHSDSVGVSLCNKCGRIRNQGFSVFSNFKSATHFSLFF